MSSDLFAQAASFAESDSEEPVSSAPATAPVQPSEEPVPVPQTVEATPVAEEALAYEEPLADTEQSMDDMEAHYEYANAIIRIAEKFRELNLHERTMVLSFLVPDAQSERIEDIGYIVVSVLNAPNDSIDTIMATVEAYDLPQVERAFYIMDLSESARDGMYSMVLGLLHEKRDEEELSSIQLSKKLTFLIDQLTEEDLSSIRAISSLFTN